jgi:hypothetical protein
MKRFSLPSTTSSKKKRKSLPGVQKVPASEIAKKLILAPQPPHQPEKGHPVDTTDESATDTQSTQLYSVERAQASENLIWKHDLENDALPLHSHSFEIVKVLDSDAGRVFATCLCDADGEEGEYKALFILGDVPVESRTLVVGSRVNVWDPVNSSFDSRLIVCSRFVLV